MVTYIVNVTATTSMAERIATLLETTNDPLQTAPGFLGRHVMRDATADAVQFIDVELWESHEARALAHTASAYQMWRRLIEQTANREVAVA